jgi:methyl-accepting chemotaxis protein
MSDDDEIHPHVTHATASGPLDFAKYKRQFEGPMHKLTRAPGAESDDGEMPPENLSDLLDRVWKNSTREIDSLIGEFERLRGKLQTDGERIKREIDEYRALSQQVMQLTNTISESVEKVRASADRPPGGPQEKE